MQKQIMHASERGDKQAVYTLQQRLMESEAARLLAVRRVAEENQGKHTAGIDGVKSLSPRERLAMASTIHPKNWRQQPALPVRRVWVPKPGSTERRPLAILPMIDRCKQALVKLALEPEWEPHFEAHSYGFRPGRGVHDAITAILVAIEGHPAFVFEADVEGAFDHINQALVLDQLQTFAALRRAISAWLIAGVIDGETYLPSETGIAQGGVLSPLLMNVALHGLEAVAAGGSLGDARSQPLLVRYADNFVMVHQDLNVLQQAVRRVKRWLATRGLQLHAEKTHLTHTLTPSQGQVGFEFLGFRIRQEGSPRVKTIITPGLQAHHRHLAAIDHKLQQLHTAPQVHVIKELNPLITNWAAYYNGLVEAAIMSRYDALLEQRLIKWASKRHPSTPRDWLLAHYWRVAGKRRRVFATAEGVQLRVYRQENILKGEGTER